MGLFADFQWASLFCKAHMDCFIDYIGLRDCSQKEPESGFFINDMSGMSIKRLDNISDSERKNYVGVWERVQKRASIEMGSRILGRFMNNWRPKMLFDNQVFGYFDGKQVLPLGSNHKGIYLFYYPSSWTEIDIPFIEVYSTSAKTGANFVVYDLNDGSLQKTFTIDLVVGYNKVDIEYSQLPRASYPARLFIGYDSSSFSLVQSNPNYRDLNNWGDCQTYPMRGFGEVALQDIEISSPFLYTHISGGIGSGISLTCNLKCSLDAFICSQRHLFKYAWAKLLVSEIYRETLDSDRTNLFTTYKGERAQEEMDKAMSDFNMSIGDILDSMDVPSDGVCFSCNEQFKTVYGLP